MKTALVITFTHEDPLDRDELVDAVLDAVVESLLTNNHKLGDQMTAVKVKDEASGESFTRELD